MLTMLKYLALVLAVAAASAYATSRVYEGRIAEIELANTQANLESTIAANKQYQNEAASIHGAAVSYSKLQGDLNLKLDAITKGLKDVQVKTPLPRDCRPDAERLRELTAAVAAANAAIARQ